MNWFHLLTIIFVVLKLCAVVTFSWWLVFLPSILSLVFGILLVTFIMIAASRSMIH